MSEWQPIETAPADGSSILLYEQSALEVFVGYFCETTKDWCPLAADPSWGTKAISAHRAAIRS